MIKQAFEIDLIDEGGIWLQLLQDRNLTSHIYNEETAKEIELQIRTQYFSLLEELNYALEKIKNDETAG